jgi:predicted RNA polymerase sigma factor
VGAPNQAVAVAIATGPRAGLELLEALQADEPFAGDHRLHAVRAHLLEMAGDRAGARDAFLAAAGRTTNLPQQRYLNARAARLADGR